jgi:hypothetical protein
MAYYPETTFGRGGPQRLPAYYGSTAPYAATVSTGQPPITTGPYGTGGVYPTGPYAGTIDPNATRPQTADVSGVQWPPQQQRPTIDFSNIDYSNDPILARVKALAEESIGQANADARANRVRLAIGLGDPELVDQLKLGSDVRKQASENTFGTFQELSRQLDRRNIFDITGNLSDKHNLFYSTERGRQLGLSGEQYLRDKSQATSAVQGQLATISQNLIAQKMAAQAQIIAAEQDAYSRALQQALYAAGVG